MRKTRKPFARSFEQHLDPVSVHDVGRMDLRLEQKALRIDQDVAFSALDLLAAIIASLLSSHAGALDRLRIDNTRGGLRITPKTDPQALADGCVEPLPGTIDAPEAKVMVDGLPRREVVRQQAPGAAAAENVEDGVEDLAQVVEARSSRGFRGWGQMGFDARPFSIGEVGLVCFSHARYPTEPLLPNPFSDSFLYRIRLNRIVFSCCLRPPVVVRVGSDDLRLTTERHATFHQCLFELFDTLKEAVCDPFVAQRP